MVVMSNLGEIKFIFNYFIKKTKSQIMFEFFNIIYIYIYILYMHAEKNMPYTRHTGGSYLQ